MHGLEIIVYTLLVGIVGFAAHRATLCSVKAIAEVFDARTTRMLRGFFKAALWAMLVYGALVVFASGHFAHFSALEPHGLAIAGGFIFGFGAALNGACSYSSLQRIADGDLAGLVTIVGMVLGVALWATLDATLQITHPVSREVAWRSGGTWAIGLLALLTLFAVIEAWRMLRARARGLTWRQRIAAKNYAISTAAMLMGVCGGLLYGIQGAWSYTNTIRRAVDAGYGSAPGPARIQVLLFAALFVGMLLSALQRKSFALRWRLRRAQWAWLSGGAIMGFGASMVPGGNDTLLLTGVPALSGWSMLAYVALLTGTAVGLAVKRRLASRTQCIARESAADKESAKAV